MVQHIRRVEDLPASRGVHEIDYRGIPIVCVNFEGAKEEEFLRVIREAAPVIRRSSATGKLLTLTNMKNAVYNRVTSAAMKEYAAANEPYVFARAVVGMSNMMRVLFGLMHVMSKLNVKEFGADGAAALDWLVFEARELAHGMA